MFRYMVPYEHWHVHVCDFIPPHSKIPPEIGALFPMPDWTDTLFAIEKITRTLVFDLVNSHFF